MRKYTDLCLHYDVMALQRATFCEELEWMRYIFRSSRTQCFHVVYILALGSLIRYT